MGYAVLILGHIQTINMVNIDDDVWCVLLGYVMTIRHLACDVTLTEIGNLRHLGNSRSSCGPINTINILTVT